MTWETYSRIDESVLAAAARELRAGEVLNHEGGIVSEADDWTRLRRYLILGSEGGTYYATQSDLTVENVKVVARCLAADGIRTVGEIVAISEAGRAPKNDPAILALAMCSMIPNDATRAYAFAAVPRVCRTGTHILTFARYRDTLGGGWGRGMRRAVGEWFLDKSPRDIAYQAVKYPSRNGWSQRDLLRLAHPKTEGERNFVLSYITHGWPEKALGLDAFDSATFLNACRLAREVNATETARLIRAHRIPREALDTTLLNDAGVWEALLEDMPLWAMVRNLNKMTQVGLFDGDSPRTQFVCEQLLDEKALAKSRIHPFTILTGLATYMTGHGLKGKLTWTPNKTIVNAMDEAFYLSFGNVPSTGKRICLALDVSSSMNHAGIAGLNLTCRQAAAAMALITANSEPKAKFVAYSDRIVPLEIAPAMRVDEVMREMARIKFGGTICSLPIVNALQRGQSFDAFLSFTDNETFDGRWGEAPTVNEALIEYRKSTGIRAKHAVAAFASNGFTIADPTDPDQLDVVGLDSATPQLLADFVGGVI